MDDLTMMKILNEIESKLPSLKNMVADKYLADIENLIFIAKNSISNSKPFSKNDIKFLNFVGLMTVKEIEDVDRDISELIHKVTYYFRSLNSSK